MSDEIQEMPPPAPAASAAPLTPAEAKVQRATDALGRAMAATVGSDKHALGALREQIEQAARMSGPEFDKRLEFCYAIVFSPELSANARLQTAAQTFIDAVKEAQE